MRDHEARPVAGAVEESGWMIPMTLDLAKDINWVTSADSKPIELFLDGQSRRLSRLPARAATPAANNIGNVIINSAQDRPWSHYFSCMMAGNPDFDAAHRAGHAMTRGRTLARFLRRHRHG